MAALSTTNFEKMLKVVYEPGRVKLRAYQNNPFLALIPKDESMRGKNRTVPIWYGTGQGVSADFATAQANKSVGQYENWVLTRVRGYAIGSIENEVLEAAQGGDKNAFLQATAEIDGHMHQLTRDVAIGLYRDPTGQRGTIAGISSNVVSLTAGEDITNFEKGMKLVARATGGTVRAAGWVVSIDRTARTFVIGTAVSTPGTPSGWIATDTLHREGDVATGDATRKFAGLASWIPTSVASSGDSHFGVDRYADRQRLAGTYLECSALGVEDAIIEGAARLHEVGAMPDLCIMGPMQFRNLIRELGSKVVHDIVKSPDMAKVGFKSVKLYTPAGVMDVVPDHNCQADTAWLLRKNTWKLYSMGPVPKPLTYGPGDGNRWLRETDEDAVEYRLGFYGQVGCNAPGENARLLLASD